MQVVTLPRLLLPPLLQSSSLEGGVIPLNLSGASSIVSGSTAREEDSSVYTRRGLYLIYYARSLVVLTWFINHR